MGFGDFRPRPNKPPTKQNIYSFFKTKWLVWLCIVAVLALLCLPHKKASPLPSTYVATYSPWEVSLDGLCVVSYQALTLDMEGYIPSPTTPEGKVAKGTSLLAKYPAEAEMILSMLWQCEWELAHAPSSLAGETEEIRTTLALWRRAWLAGDTASQTQAEEQLRLLCATPQKEADLLRMQAVCQWLKAKLPSPTEQYIAPYEGFFSLQCDGYEDIWDKPTDTPLTCEAFINHLNTSPTPPACAKLISGIETKLYMWVETAGLLDVALGQKYTLRLADGTSIDAILSAMQNDADSPMSLLTFLSTSFSFFDMPKRIQNATLVMAKDTLLRVPKEAVLFDGAEGYVLVRHGSRLLARGIVIQHETDKWAYLAQRKGTLSLLGETCLYLKAGESVCITTNGLYHRMVLP